MHPNGRKSSCSSRARALATLRNTEAGYTLLELLVVLVVIGLLVAVATPQLMRVLGGAKSDAAKLQIDSLSTSVDYYQLDFGSYPSQADGLKVLWEKPKDAPAWNGPYVRKESQLKDPWGKPYQYKLPGEHGAFDIFTWGADGKPGGSGEDADHGNWD